MKDLIQTNHRPSIRARRTRPDTRGLDIIAHIDAPTGLLCHRARLGGFYYTPFEMAYDARVMGQEDWRNAQRQAAAIRRQNLENREAHHA